MSVKSRLSDILRALPKAVKMDAVQQAGAICCRMSSRDRIEVLLITSRQTGRWVIPRGNINLKEPAFRCAQREAFEEAGVSGKTRRKPLGHYRYEKDGQRLLTVSVHLMRVDHDASQYPESDERKKIWVRPSKAASLVFEPGLAELFRLINGDGQVSLSDRIFRRHAGSIAARPAA